jgi:hypothetical protein
MNPVQDSLLAALTSVSRLFYCLGRIERPQSEVVIHCPKMRGEECHHNTPLGAYPRSEIAEWRKQARGTRPALAELLQTPKQEDLALWPLQVRPPFMGYVNEFPALYAELVQDSWGFFNTDLACGIGSRVCVWMDLRWRKDRVLHQCSGNIQ